MLRFLPRFHAVRSSCVGGALLLILLMAGAPQSALGQAPVTARNAFYLELLGNGFLYSLNYDRLLTDQISGRVGFMFLGAASDTSAAALAAAPIMVNYLVGQGNSHFEAGIGVTLLSGGIENVEDFEDEDFNGAIGTATLGYRYQRPAGGFVFRVGLTPFFGAGGIVPYLGVSFGYGF